MTLTTDTHHNGTEAGTEPPGITKRKQHTGPSTTRPTRKVLDFPEHRPTHLPRRRPIGQFPRLRPLFLGDGRREDSDSKETFSSGGREPDLAWNTCINRIFSSPGAAFGVFPEPEGTGVYWEFLIQFPNGASADKKVAQGGRHME